MKVIFLDVDGVLVNAQTLKTNTADPDCVARLNILASKSGASIVVSSTWRLFHPDNIAEILQGWGVTAPVIGKTPDLTNYGKPITQSQARGTEIQAWLSKARVPVESFVILDDADDMGDLLHALVQTKFEPGLTNVDVLKALDVLDTFNNYQVKKFPIKYPRAGADVGYSAKCPYCGKRKRLAFSNWSKRSIYRYQWGFRHCGITHVAGLGETPDAGLHLFTD